MEWVFWYYVFYTREMIRRYWWLGLFPASFFLGYWLGS